MRDVDLIVHGVDWLITMDSDRRIYRDGALAVAGDIIVEVGKSDAIMQRYQAKRLLSGHRTVVLPGLVDGHLHSSFQMSRGLADDVAVEAGDDLARGKGHGETILSPLLQLP